METYFPYLNKIKSVLSRKYFWRMIWHPHRNEFLVALILSLSFFLVASAGQMIAVIGSRQIIEPVTVEVRSSSGEEISSFQTYMQLARAGNYSPMGPKSDVSDEWSVKGVFIKKLLVGIDTKDIPRLSSIHITIGEKKFDISSASAITEWKTFDKSSLRSELRVSQDDYDNFVLLEIPTEVGLPRSKIPIYKDFFGSIINWGGDHLIFEEPIKRALVTTGVFILFLFILRMVFLVIKECGLLKHNDEEGVLLSKKKFIIFFIVLLSTVGAIFLLVVLIYIVYKPDVAQILLKSSHEYTVYFSRQFRPKPVERLQFVLSLFSVPFILLGLYYWFSKKITITNKFVQRWYWAFVCTSFLFVYSSVYLGLAMSGFFYIRDSIFYENSIVKFLYIFLFFPVGLVWFFIHKNLSVVGRIFLYGLTLCVISVIFFMTVTNANNHFLPINSPVLPAIDPVLYPVSQAVMGKNVLVNLDSYYGAFPFLIAPLFKLIDLSVLSFSVLMSLLMVVSVVCIFFAMKKIVQDKTIFFLGFLTTIFYSLLATRVVPDYFFQYWPIRFLFPCVSLLLVILYIKNSTRFLYYFSFGLYSIGILWNAEIGLVVFLSWLALLVYQEAVHLDTWQIRIVNIVKHMLKGVCVLAIVLGAFVYITYLQSGKIPDFLRLAQYQKVFLSGYLMVKMIPPPHMWFVIVLMYLAGILIAVRAFVEKTASYREKYILFLSILGFGLFSYYAGQSMDIYLLRIQYPAVILMVVFTDILWKKIKVYGGMAYGDIMLFVCMLCVVFATPFNLFLNWHKYYEFIGMGLSAFVSKDDTYLKNIDFIKKYTSENENIFILSFPNQGIYYAESKTRSAIDVTSVIDILFPEEMEKLIFFLENNKSIKIFAEQPLEKYDDFDPRLKKIILDKYKEIEKSGHGMSLYQMQ